MEESMTFNDKLELLNKLQHLIEANRAELDKLEEVLPGFFESPLMNSCFYIEDQLVATTAALIDIDVDSLRWHVYENKFNGGYHCKQAGDDATVSITDNETFLKFEFWEL
jgi:hypothetical protein